MNLSDIERMDTVGAIFRRISIVYARSLVLYDLERTSAAYINPCRHVYTVQNGMAP